MKISKTKIDKGLLKILDSINPYKGRKFFLEVRDKVWIDRIGGGGSKDYPYIITKKEDQWIVFHPTVSIMNAPCGYYEIPEGVLLAMRRFFCGTDIGWSFYIKDDKLKIEN